MYARGFLVGLLFGAAIGTAVSLLYAPIKGEEAREILARKTRTAADKVGQIKAQAGAKAHKVGEGIKQAI